MTSILLGYQLAEKRMTNFNCDTSKQQRHARGWSLRGRVALVTGAAGGLGKAIVAELAERGADVHGVDVVGEGVFHADLATASGNRDMVAHALTTSGRLDILVLNAGCQFIAPLDQFPDAEWDRLNAVMLDGPFHAMKAAWPALTKSAGGRVVVTASVASYGGGRQKAAYCAAKHGVLGLVRTAALEGGAHGLTVARHGKLPPQRHEELPPPRIAEERVNEAGTNHGKLVVD